jgi:hypothetical protein
MNKWFRHDSNAHNDPKIIEMIDDLGIESYGIFWVLIELLRDQSEYRLPVRSIPGIAKRYGIEKGKVEKVIHSFELFEIDIDDYFFSESLKKRMGEFEKKSILAKTAAEKRWNLSTKNADAMRMQCGRNADAMPTQCDRNAITLHDITKDINKNIHVKTSSFDETEQSESDVKKRINYQEVIDLFNSICVSLPRIIKLTDQRKTAIKARLAEYSYADIKIALEMAESSDWLCRNEKWQASFDWIMNKNNMPKVLEGNYANKTQAPDKPQIQKTREETKLSCNNPYCRNGYRYLSTKQGSAIRRCECWADAQSDQVKRIPIITEEEKQYER